MLPHFVQDTLWDSAISFTFGITVADTYHVVPCRNNGLHIEIAREECDDAIGHNLTVLHQNASKIPNNGGVVSYLEARADGNLITAPSYDLISYVPTHAMNGKRVLGTHEG